MSDTAEPLEDFSGKRAAEIVGISYRQLDYWARTDLIRPDVADAKGSGSRRKYSYRNLVELKLVKTLLDNGIKLEQVRKAFGYVREQLGERAWTSAWDEGRTMTFDEAVAFALEEPLPLTP